jgi:hypothetical protein
LVALVQVKTAFIEAQEGALSMITNLLQLTEPEQTVVEERLGASAPRVVHLLLEARQWAYEHTTPDEFDSRFPEFVAAYRLNPALADVAAVYVLSHAGNDEVQEVDRRGFELMLSRKPPESWNEADEKTWAAFMESCDKEYATPSQRLVCQNIIERGTPTTRTELEEAWAFAHLREWVRSQVH